MKYLCLLLTVVFFLFSCSQKENIDKEESSAETTKKYSKFNGNYNKTFNDLPDLHTASANKYGIGPLETRGDTAKYGQKLVKIPTELEIYKVDRLTHSIPFLVPEAATLLSDIGLNFRDSLISKNMPQYKLIVTSITRTNEDVKGLSKRNVNASQGSVHRYATTFDIAWTRYQKVDPTDQRTMDDGKLKAVLGQVLHDLRERERCYIKHERKQSCFHITVR